MRIGIIYSGSFPEGIGATARVRYIAQLMQRLGARPTVLVTLPSPYVRMPSTFQGRSPEGIPYRYVGGLIRRRRGWVKFYDYFVYFRTIGRSFPEEIDHFDAFYVYASTPYFLEPVLQVLRRSGRPFVVEKTELHAALNRPFRSWKERLSNWLAKQYEESILRGPKALLVISTALEQRFRNFNGPILHLPIMADYSRFTPVPFQRPPQYRIGYMGAFSSKDGIDGILRTFLRLHNTMPRVRLSLIGYSPAIRRIRQWVERYRLSHAVDFQIGIPNADLPLRLAECDTLLMNRRDVPASRYGFPTKLSEYLATANPVIATGVGDIPRWFTHQRHLWMIPPDNETALENAIRKRYAEYVRFQRIGQEGRRFGEQHFHYERYLPVIHRVLNLLSS